MTTQEEFWASLGQGSAVKSDEPLPPTLKFTDMNVPIQGIVTDVYMGTQKGFNGAPDPVDANGNPRPQMVLTLKVMDDCFAYVGKSPVQLKAGDLGRMFLKNDLLWKTRDAMAEQGLSSIPNGALWGGAWTGVKTDYNNAREHKVQLRVK